MKEVVAALVLVAPPFLKVPLLRRLGGARIGRHVHIGWFSTISAKHISIGDYAEIRAFSIMHCAGEVKIGAYAVISNFVLVYGLGSFSAGKHCYIGSQCWINAEEEVRIGNVSALGPRCMIFTHGSFLPYTEGYWAKLAGVTIGNYVWLAAGVFVHPGVRVGDRVFANSRAVITHDLQSGEVVAGFPAEPVGRMENLQRHMTPSRQDEAARHMLAQFAKLILSRKLGIEVQTHDDEDFRFRAYGREYALFYIPAEGEMPDLQRFYPKARMLALVNRPNWTAAQPRRRLSVFNMTTMKTGPWRDGVQRELWQFMRMYFGVTFEFE